jgi:hypothetical protein
MTRSLVSTTFVLASAILGVSGCAANVDSPTSEAADSVASITESLTDCTAYNGYTAAIAEATIDCIGAVGPSSFFINKETRLLERRFEKCTVQSEVDNLLRIDRLLTLQNREKDLPSVIACIPLAYQAWQRIAIGSNLSVCPDWHKLAASGIPSHENVQNNAQGLPKLPDPDPRTPVNFGKQQFLYELKFPRQPPENQKCQTEADCAKLCTGGFAGFFVKASGTRAIGDPYWWLDPTDYGSDDPYMEPDYFHPMSYAGDDVPGELFGDFARVGEVCSVWNGFEHVNGMLKMDMLVPSDARTWLSRCE